MQNDGQMQLGKKLWQQAESTIKDEDYETIGKEWKRRFKEEWDEDNALEVYDIRCPRGGDSMIFEMPNGFLAVVSFDGWAIHEKAN